MGKKKGNRSSDFSSPTKSVKHLHIDDLLTKEIVIQLSSFSSSPYEQLSADVENTEEGTQLHSNIEGALRDNSFKKAVDPEHFPLQVTLPANEDLAFDEKGAGMPHQSQKDFVLKFIKDHCLLTGKNSYSHFPEA